VANEKLFTAVYIPDTPFVKGVLKPRKEKKYNFRLLEGKNIESNLYHFIYKKGEQLIHSYYFKDLRTDSLGKNLFVENNALYDDFISQFSGKGHGCWERCIDVYLDVDKPGDIYQQLTNVFNNSFYDEDEETPICHIFGQKMWHDNAYMIANRTALLELKDAIDVALKFEETRLNFSPSDGEGYELFIKCVGEDFKWKDLEMPYHDRECYVPNKLEELPPHKVFKKYKP